MPARRGPVPVGRSRRLNRRSTVSPWWIFALFGEAPGKPSPYLREQGIAVMGRDFGGDKATFGWVFEVLAMITAGLALWLALTMREGAENSLEPITFPFVRSSARNGGMNGFMDIEAVVSPGNEPFFGAARAVAPVA